ncbi:DUF952 domain-containing protein [Micromonospora sp. WMMD980]|uniref:DUF952 domain-containing protein n=1 Tax=Micromonospora sp. WMMD980 TaxID=3016088 RepID=UPI002417CC35|nr:DUF952 domain-containing protein [Micromonospora sp. WMMD980]MDG4801845.1 DUF952 domain-containing protein [Micromonospora sp. WMMD980]
MIYKILADDEWRQARADGRFAGSALDRQDGYLHLSAADQVVETARRHFGGVTGLTLLAVDEARLGDALRWEASRGGALFPHLYGALPVDAVVAAHPLPADRPPADAVAELLGRGARYAASSPARRRDAPRHDAS